MKLVMSCGNANVDIFMVVDDFPRTDQEVIARDLYVMMGGSAANFAVALSKLGTPTCFVGCIGDDELGKEFIKDLELNNVRTKYVIKIPERGTGRVFILVKASTGEKVMVAYRGANECLSAELFPSALFEEARHFHISSVPPDKAQNFLRAAKDKGISTSYDPGGYAAKGFDAFKDVFPYVNILFLNRIEAKMISGAEDLNSSAKRLVKEGVDIVTIKLGDKGSMSSDGKRTFYVQAFKVPVIDTTGAGDVFDAGFVYGYLMGLEFEECLTLGNIVACLKIMRKGARASPNLSEVITFALDKELFNIVSRLRGQ